MPNPSEILRKATYRPRPEEIFENEYEAFGFMLNGEVAEDVRQNDCVLKSVKDLVSQETTYWVRKGTVGPETGHLLNPHNPDFPASKEAQDRLFGETSKYRYEFRKVNQDVFDLYLKFLQTGNMRYYRQADREAM